MYHFWSPFSPTPGPSFALLSRANEYAAATANFYGPMALMGWALTGPNPVRPGLCSFVWRHAGDNESLMHRARQDRELVEEARRNGR